jgi:hypothetical protein
MQPVIEQLEKLQDGFQISIDGKNSFVRFCLAYVHGDSKVLNEILGFTCSLNASFNCRFCRADNTTLQTMCLENSCLLRNRQNYKTDLKLNDVSQTGIREEYLFKFPCN